MFQRFNGLKSTKGFLLFAFVLLVFFNANAQRVAFSLISSNNQEVVIRVDFPNYQTNTVSADGSSLTKLFMDDAYPMLDAGKPELLQTSTAIVIPTDCTPSFEILQSDYQFIQNVDLAPSKGRLYRNINPDDISYEKGGCYSQDRFFFDDTVALGEPYQLRDYTGMPVHFYPFAYNPVQKTLKAYSYVIVKIHFNSTKSIQHPTKVSQTFQNIYKEHFLNYTSLRSTTSLDETGDILILAPENFCAAMQPYADWKIKNGYNTEIVSLNTAGNSSSAIKNYIRNYYNSHNLDFVVLVGDNGQFPTISVGGNVSDNYYGEIAGNDHYPDVIIGKISAENVDQVNTQVNRFIQYEQNPPETSHFPVFCGIASSQGPGDNNEYDYAHIRNIDNKLSNYTYTSGYELFEGSQGGLDASGSPTSTLVANTINSGVGIVNYCGHGDNTLWGTSNFNVNNINNLTNYNKLPFIISVACLNGNYSGRTCFAEAWLRANKNGQPTGAVGALMSTISQPWNSPMCAQDKMIELLTGANNTPQKYTFGGIAFNGMIHMLDEYDDYEVSRTWILFGDPAMMVRTAVPQVLNISYPMETNVGSPSIDVDATAENAKITLTHNQNILCSGTISNGHVTLPLPNNLLPNDTIVVLATAPNYLPVEGNILVIPNVGPYIIKNDLTIHDNGNEDGQADYGETISLDVNFKNIGSKTANNIRITVSSDCPYITLKDSLFSYSQLQPSETKNFNNLCQFKIHSNIPAFQNAVLKVKIQYDTTLQEMNLLVPLHAPQLNIGEIIVKDTAGNNNGRLDFNEHATLLINVFNNGNGCAKAGQTYISNPDGKLNFYRWPSDIPALAVDQSHNAVAYISVKPNVTEPTTTTLRVTYYADGYKISKDFVLKIGSKIEGWESGDFSAYDWNLQFAHPWVITTQNPYEGNYAASSAIISNNQTSQIDLTITTYYPDTLSFYYTVSSEANYDELLFYIDNNLKDAWSGEVGWSKAAYLVDAGTHTFSWRYKKDNYSSSGKDRAMIDLVNLPCLTSSVNIESFVVNEDVNIYPNPTSGSVNVQLGDLERANYQLFDLTGQQLQQGTLQNNDKLSLEHYSAGIYLLRIYHNNHFIKNIKIVKQ